VKGRKKGAALKSDDSLYEQMFGTFFRDDIPKTIALLPGKIRGWDDSFKAWKRKNISDGCSPHQIIGEYRADLKSLYVKFHSVVDRAFLQRDGKTFAAFALAIDSRVQVSFHAKSNRGRPRQIDLKAAAVDSIPNLHRHLDRAFFKHEWKPFADLAKALDQGVVISFNTRANFSAPPHRLGAALLKIIKGGLCGDIKRDGKKHTVDELKKLIIETRVMGKGEPKRADIIATCKELGLPFQN
jgi:hypothetical protein